MFRHSVTREYHFSYAHRLHNPNLTEELNEKLFGKCCNNHGHNAKVFVTIEGPLEHGMVINFHAMDDLVLPTTEDWDHKELTHHPDFQDRMCTAESMAEILFERVKAALIAKTNAAIVTKVEVYENDKSCATYTR